MARKEQVKFLRCPKCGLLWAPELDIDMTFRSHLNEEKRQQALQDARNKEFDNVLTLLKKILPPPERDWRWDALMDGL